MNNWKVFLDLEHDGQLWHIANEEHTGSICSAEAEIQGLPIDYDPMGTKPMCSECFKIAARKKMDTQEQIQRYINNSGKLGTAFGLDPMPGQNGVWFIMDNITTPAFLRSELEEIGFDVIHVVLDGAAGARSTNAVATFRVPEDLVLVTEPAPPAAETGARGDVSMPLDGEAFDEWVTRVGRSVEDTAFYWKQIAADNLELAADNGAEVETLRSQLAAAQAALKPFAFCPIHPDWPDDTRCVILMNWNKPGLEVSVNEGLTLGDVRRAVAAKVEATEA